MTTETMFPKALRAMRKLRARGARSDPKTAEKNREAASSVEVLRSALGTCGTLASLDCC